MASVLRAAQKLLTCSWGSPTKKGSIFTRLDNHPDLLRHWFKFLPAKDIVSYVRSHRVSLGKDSRMSLRYILRSQMEGELGEATWIRVQQFQRINVGKFFQLNENIYHLDLSNSDVTPQQLDGMLQACPNVRNLNLSGCAKIKNINVLTRYPNIQALTLKRCDWFTDLSALASLKELLYLNLEDCNSLRDINFLKALVKLRVLNLSRCWMVRDFDPIGNLTQLYSLYLYQCHIPNVAMLMNLKNLQVVYHDRDFSRFRAAFKDLPIRLINLERR